MFELDPLEKKLKERLEFLSTAVIASQLLKRGLRHSTISGLLPINVDFSRMVGPAFTLGFIPMREDLGNSASQSVHTNPQRIAIEEIPAGHVLVIDARGELESGGFGDILAARLLVRGVAGVVSDGAMRDSAQLRKLALPIFCAGSAAPPSFARIMAANLNRPIGCGGVAVFPGDVVVADIDGAVVIPRHLADEVARDGVEQERLERFVRSRVDRGETTVGLYPPNEAAMADYRRWCEENGGGFN
jgi:regulator of RNase E activity RraA